MGIDVPWLDLCRVRREAKRSIELRDRNREEICLVAARQMIAPGADVAYLEVGVARQSLLERQVIA